MIIDFSPAFQQERDIELLCLAFGHVAADETTKEFMLPHGEMACDMFDREVDEAFERLTPRQQTAMLNGQFQLKPRFRMIPLNDGGEPWEEATWD